MKDVFVNLVALVMMLVCWMSRIQAEPIVLHSDPLVYPSFDRNVQHYFDEARRFDRDQRDLLRQNFVFSPSSERVDVGFTKGILWARLQLLQDFNGPQNLVLSFGNSFSRLRLFELVDGRLKEISRLGGGYAREEQSFRALGTHLPLRWVVPGLHEYVLAAESDGGRLDMAFSVSTAATWIEDVLFPQYFGKGLFYGMVCAVLLFNVFVFINSRDRAYAVYVGYILSMLFLFLNLDGIMDFVVPWPNAGGWTTFTAAFAGLFIVFITLVNKIYFDSRVAYPQIDKLFNGGLLGGFLLIAGTFILPSTAINRLVDVVTMYGIMTVFATSAYVWHKGFLPAKYVFMGRLIFTIFVSIFMLHLYGFFPENFLVVYSLQIGSVCDMLIMSYGLGVRMRLLELEKAEAREGERQASFKLNWFNTLVRVITHDLSTPVSVITTTSDMELRRPQPSKTLQKNLERIARASRQQANLINHVRDMIAVASGKKELELKPVCLNQALEEAINSLAEMAEKKQLIIDLNCPQHDIYVAADPTAMVSTVLDNFISNAIKFSEQGSVVRLVLQETASCALIKIIDSGIGIPDELIDHLFDPAHATSRPGTDREIGTGFGLPLAHVYIEQFHGRITVESHTEKAGSHGRGTCFTIELPLLSMATPSTQV